MTGDDISILLTELKQINRRRTEIRSVLFDLLSTVEDEVKDEILKSFELSPKERVQHMRSGKKGTIIELKKQSCVVRFDGDKTDSYPLKRLLKPIKE